MSEILEIAQKYLLGVKKTGPENIMAFCPFHDNQNTPSFTMSITKGLYFCFSCEARGNLPMFLRSMGVSGLLIERRYKHLIDEVAHFTPKKLNPLRPGVFEKDPIPESLLGLFQFCPVALEEEGYPADLLEEYDVGFDKDHMRITYPLRDLGGKLMGISGRAVLNEQPRYKVYDHEFEKWGLPFRRTEKRKILWNANRVYPSAYLKNDAKIIVVEGFKACLRLIQYGFPDTVALLGNYLSPEHQWILERIGGEVYLMLDNDEPGQLGTARVASRLAGSLTVKVVEYPEEKPQPSDLSPQEVHQALVSAPDYYRWATEERNRWLLERTRRA